MATELLTFDGELLAPLAIECEDLTGLRDFMMRGENRILPGAPGRRALDPVLDELDTTLTWKVRGRWRYDGDLQDDPIEGVAVNLEHYRALFFGGGGHTISLQYAGSVFTDSEVQVPNYAAARTGPFTATILTRFVIPPGELEEEGS